MSQQTVHFNRGCSKPREVKPETDARLDGTYKILSVHSGEISSGFKVDIEDVNTGDKITVDVPSGTLSDKQKTILQGAEWGKKPSKMQINIKKLGDKIKSATLIEAGIS